MYVRSSKVLVTYAPRSIFHVQFAMYNFHMQSKSVFLSQKKLKAQGLLTDDGYKRREAAAIDIYIDDMDRLAGEDLEQSAKKRGEPNAPLSLKYVAPQGRCVLYTLLLLLLFR